MFVPKLGNTQHSPLELFAILISPFLHAVVISNAKSGSLDPIYGLGLGTVTWVLQKRNRIVGYRFY